MWRRNRRMSKSSLEWFSITGAQNISSRFSTIKTWPTNLDTWSRRRLPITNLTESFLSFGVSSADKPSFKQHNLWVKQTNRLKMITWLKLKVKVSFTEILKFSQNLKTILDTQTWWDCPVEKWSWFSQIKNYLRKQHQSMITLLRFSCLC